MKRLLSTMRLDLTLQFRNGFYYVSAGLVLLLVVALRQFFDRAGLALVLPVFYLLALAGTTYIFIAGMILFEKGQRTLEGVIVTPLRSDEYLISKLITLTGLALIESLLIVLLTYGLGFDPWLLLGGIASMALIYGLASLIVVARYDSVTDFLIPSMLLLLLLQLNFIDYFDIWSSPLFYLFPTQPPLLLMRAAFAPIATWQLIYAIVGTALWSVVGYIWAKHAFERYIVRQERSV